MRRTLEVIFRRLSLLLFLLLLAPIVGLAIVYPQPRLYQSTASLWALHRYIIIGATGPEMDLQSTPADTQTAALTELLHSTSFMQDIQRDTGFAATLGLDNATLADPQRLEAAMLSDMSHHVQITADGYNLFTVTYTNQNPEMARRVILAIINNFGVQSQAFSIAEAQRLLDLYQTQLNQSQQQLKMAVSAQTQYIAAHPDIAKTSLATDPVYLQLQAQTQQAQASVANAQTSLTTIHQEVATQGSGTNGLFQVLDQPLRAVAPISRMKDLLMGGGIGLGVALLMCVMYILIAVRRDRTIYSADELQKVVGLPVIMQLPLLNVAALPLPVHSANHLPRL